MNGMAALRSALRLMLKQHQLTYIIQNEVLMITTPDQAATRLRTVRCSMCLAAAVLPLRKSATDPGFSAMASSTSAGEIA